MMGTSIWIVVVSIICIIPHTSGVRLSVKIKTGTRDYAGTSANVYMDVYGTLGSASRQFLGNDFSNGDINYKDVYIDVGRINSITVYHDDTGLYSGWDLDYIEITDTSTALLYTFRCGCWVENDDRRSINSQQCYYNLPIDNCQTTPESVSCHIGRCTQCVDGYYINGYGCSSCGSITDCSKVLCTSLSNRWCAKCRDADLFKLDNGGRTCTRTCSWEDRWCWPGTCGSPDTHNYARDCVCDDTSFRRVYDSTQAKCECSETVNTFPIKVDPNSNNPLNPASYDRILDNSFSLENGQRLCLRYAVQGGGHMISKNVQTHYNHSVPYPKTATSRELCYWYDDVAPIHCLEHNSCSAEPLDTTHRLLTSLDFTVTFTGWDDPSPVIGDTKFASGIHTYVVNLYDVKESGTDFLDVSRVPVIPGIEKSSPVDISIPSDLPNPAMYAVVLEVKDVANNVKKARRFVMFDNSSTIVTRDDRPIYSTTASQETDYSWQTILGKICYSWIDRYLNDKFYHLNLLKPIKQDYHGLISGVYEQTTGILPVAGTENVHGLTMFHYMLSRDEELIIQKTEVPNFTSQALCVSPTLSDGETYLLNIVAEDIMSHSYSESLSTHIDSSEPEILNMWLEKDGYKRLFVHNSTDLSKMILTFNTLDIHSGIYSVDWSLGTSFGGNDIAQGSLSVQRIGTNMSCPDDAPTCYCPSVGPCSYHNFTLQLNSLVHSNTHNGNHNRQYHFTITATNVARLVHKEHLVVLADDSPPVPGVVMEGAVGTPDIDYTSKETAIVNWAGFIDHESGIRLYKIGLATECLQIADFISSNDSTTRNNTFTKETTSTSVHVSLPEDGKYYVTVVAYNNAMEPSQPVCSDGIVLDRTAPKVENLTLQSATMKETILCSDGSAWLITSNLSKLEISDAECSKQCMNSTTNEFVSFLPHNISYITRTTPTCGISSTHGITYLPIDLINIKWDIVESDSQIHEAFIGIGSAKDSVESPDLIDYHKSHHKYFYKKRHTGLSNGDEFYVFVRVTNSAGLQTTAVLGPILLDESPPLCPTELISSFHGDTMFIHWNRNDFSDNEQQEAISSFFCQIGRDGSVVSGFKPLLITDCGESMCFKLDLSDIQVYDIQEKFEFYIEVYAFNNAGYYCTVNTEPFYLPSSLPPGHGIVYDVTSDEQSHQRYYDDVDVMLASSQFCVAWEGFEHHGAVGYELGVGLTPGADNVIPFHQIGDDGIHCEADTNLTQYTRYFTAIRASSTGGGRVGISDGFSLVNEYDIGSSILQVYDGQGCSGQTESLNITVIETEELDLIPIGIPLHIGHAYTLIANASVSVLSKEARVYNHRQIKHLYYVSFVPMVQFPRFNMSSNDHASSYVSVYVSDCIVDYDVMLVSQRVSAYWINDDLRQYVSHYEVELQALSPDSAKNSDQMTIAYGKSAGNVSTYSFNDISLGLGRYVISVRPCIGDICFKWTSSNGFVVTDPTYNDFNIEAYLDKTESTCSNIKLTISDVECSPGIDNEKYFIVRWGVFQDSMATKQVTKWSAYQLSENITDKFMISQCIEIPLYPHQPLFTCVEVYCPVGPSGVQCAPIMVTEDPNIFDKTILYEVDTDTDIVKYIKDSIHTSNIGHRLARLHEAELDFTPKPVRVGGIILGMEERQVTWYLLKDTKQQPLSCDNNPLCVAVIQTLGGYCAFQRMMLENEILHYVCAEIATYTTINGQVLPSFQSCGDGFIIDENSPATGYISISSQNGYITDNRHLLVHWDGFHDYHGYKNLGYPDSISKYEYSVGSNPYGQDVVAKTKIGLSNSVKISSPNLHSGSTYYATVTAFDHVGHSSTVVSTGILYDDTPPVIGTLHVGRYLMSHDTIGAKVSIHWTGFRDDESGIGRIQLGIGSTQSTPDIIDFRDFQGEFATFTDLSELHDGHKYFIIMLVTNKAGLTLSSSEAFVIDQSPPTEGTVRDGIKVQTPDVDFQANTTHTGCHWSGFSDPHSGELYYTAGLGTRPSEDDVRIMTSTGTQTAIKWQHILVPGVKYFCTVKACNGAELCTSVSSNGFTADTSPPIPGIVHVGIDGHHSRFWAHPDTIQAQWFGFSDVESGIRSYNVCIRRVVSKTCDVLPFTNFLLADYMTISVSLPLVQALCVVVRAENHLGMFADSVSDSFVVDASSPVVVNIPALDSEEGYTSAEDLYQFDTSIIKLSWKFQDSESPIIKHIVSLTTHHEGHTPVENIHLTNVDELRISLINKDWLKSGDTYIAKVTACNEAGLCTSATSNSILIDSTPPHLGGITEPMTWYSVTASGKTVSAMNITLSGFRDVESGIKLYHVKVGKTYSGSELSDGVLSFEQSNSEKDTETIQVVLTDILKPGQLLIIIVWAENHAGLRSAVGKVTVTVVSSNDIDPHGELLILRHSCDIHYCNKDCTCAAVGQKCHDVDVTTECRKSNQTDLISLHIDIVHGSRHTPISASSSCISARWTAYGSGVDNITRYEWSMGQANMPVGTGIFDPLHENMWYDVGHQLSIVYCLSGERYLKHDTSYVVYLRAWISASDFIEFMSSPVHIDNTPPSVRMGRFIRENNERSCDYDIDFTSTLDTLTACWKNVFTDPQSGIHTYLVSMGTTPGGDDVITTVGEGLNTSKSWCDLTLFPGTKYYVTVTAINHVGLHTTLVSDGVLVDQERPYTGVVFNTAKFHNCHAQNSQDVGVSFRGFADRHSAIETFFVAFDKSANTSTGSLMFERIGLRNTFTFDNNNLTDGQWHRFAVKALDAAGFESEIIFSPPFIYDSSPPTGFETRQFANLYNETLATENGTFFWSKMFVKHARQTSVYMLHLIFDGIGNDTSNIVEVSFENQRHFYPIRADMNDVYEVQTSFVSSSLFNDCSITIQMENVETDLKIRVLLDVSENSTRSNHTDGFVIVQQVSPSELNVSVNVLDEESGIKNIHVGAGSTRGGFQTYPLVPVPSSSNILLVTEALHGQAVHITAIVENHAGDRSHFHSSPIVMDHTPPFISNAVMTMTYDSSRDTSVTKINVTWEVTDVESSSTQCSCILVESANKTVLDEIEMESFLRHFQTHPLPLKHGIMISALITCINDANLEQVAHVGPELVAYLPPDVENAEIFIDTSAETSDGVPVVRPSSSLMFSWGGIDDSFGIKGYSYRILQGVQITKDWEDTEMRTYVSVEDVDLIDNRLYTVEVKAFDNNGVYSKPINASVFVSGDVPSLTGYHPRVIKNGNVLEIVWSGVFAVRPELLPTYIVTLGSNLGLADMLRRLETIEERYVFQNIYGGSDVFAIITCTYQTGESSVFRGKLSIS